MQLKEWKNIWFLFKDIVKYDKKVVIDCFAMAILSAIEPFINIILMGKTVDLIYIGSNIQEIFQIICIFIGIRWVTKLIINRTTESFNRKFDDPQLFCSLPYNIKALNMDYAYLENAGVQELRFRALQKTWLGTASMLMQNLRRIIQNIASIIFAVCIVYNMLSEDSKQYGWLGSRWTTLLLILIIIVVSVISYFYSISCVIKANAVFSEYGKVHNKELYYKDLGEKLENQKDIRMNHYEALLMYDLEQIKHEMEICKNKRVKIFRRRDIFDGNTNLLIIMLIYLFTGLRAYIGMITIGSVVTYAGSFIQFTQAIRNTTEIMGDLKMTALCAADYVEFMLLKKIQCEGNLPIEKRRDNRFKVEFEHVSFRYPGSEIDVIKDLNISFEIGGKMAIVGKNGSGKTTFIKLLCRLYDVTDGVIKINGIDIRKYNYNEYCNLFSVVFQDSTIFGFKLGENIAASEEVDEEKALTSLCKAGLEERIKTLSMQMKGSPLEAYVGKEVSEQGINFSGGEKQKMGIARAIYKDAPFVIMDEPTAALDPISECEVFAGFDKMVGDKTALYISHRLASCRFCETILVFDQGQVVQTGSHEELEKQEGLYHELWHAQAQYYV